MTKIARKTVFFLFAALVAGLITTSCKDEIPDELVDYALGWIGDQENLGELEDAIDLSSTNPSSGANLPSSANLIPKFPPIGNQGSYGTCVAWACAYNLKTYLEGKDKGLSTSDLASTSNQFSPKDMFWAIPNENKGGDCNGTGFEYALDIMVSRGVAKLSTVPYTGLGDCSSSASDWEAEAASYKIDNYREIAIDVATIKGYLADDRPVVIGAKLGDNFMNWNSSSILTSDNDTYNGQHAYHAMILGGYDDSKGPSGAFKVVNSWGTTWGDAGYIWVSYDFFVNPFCFAAFVATNKSSDPNYDPDVVDDVSGKDLVGWALADDQDPTDYGSGPQPTNRACSYNVYNVGQSVVPGTDRWNILYLYYNAYDGEDFGIILYDYYTDEYCSYGSDGNLSNIPGATLYGTSGNWWNCLDVPSGVSVADALYGGTDNYFSFPYTMPNITGDYYLVMIADGFDVVSEYDEANNYLYYTHENGDPWRIVNGVVDESGLKSASASENNFKTKPGANAASPFASVRTETNVNAYSTKEIGQMIRNHYETGKMQTMLKNFDKTHSTKTVKKAIK